ncbi:hypothetical protein [Roseicitreum antarcticum]|uniref:Uncharacterized protein n=1 Tax=Roseicitreum antarcticum TaxID=564137 RepID=A0A1H2U090_9RHOB|nr:hypothetical protein [Roseicitreum antarcticum]SDW49410.1 hypothetical protein SAMN04488238_102232 [Roseicitreum antarcticum]
MDMKIIFHLGVHMTDEERLLRCLIKNRDVLSREDIAVPGPGKYRALLRNTLVELDGAPAAPQAEQALYDQLLDGAAARRLVLSSDSFLAQPRWSLNRDHLYPSAAERCPQLMNLFPSAKVEFHMAVRNPATLLPALAQTVGEDAFQTLLQTLDPSQLRWSDTVAMIRKACPGAPITLWCDEDTPFIWPEILRAVSGHSEGIRLGHTYDWFKPVMREEGLQKMMSWLSSHPPETEEQRRRIVAAFLDKFMAEEVSATPALIGWTEDTMDALTELYEQDIDQIAEIDGVTLITP